MKISTRHIHHESDGSQTITNLTVTWNQVRSLRNEELLSSDWRFMSDQSPSQEWIDYRQFLRDLPSNYETPNEAADAWNDYTIPE